MRGTKKYKIVKCFRHFGAIIILLWLISIVRFPYSFDKLQVLSNKNFESVSGKGEKNRRSGRKRFKFYVNSC